MTSIDDGRTPGGSDAEGRRGSIDALRAEAQRDPLADAPRMVLADALEQAGDVDRAQLVRLQTTRSGLAPWDPRVSELELAERAILERRGEAWRAELPQITGVTWGSFTRGFVSRVAFDKLDLLAKHRDACLAATPIHGVSLRWPPVKSRPAIEAIEGMIELTVIGTVMRPDDLRWLAGSPLLSTVRTLSLVDSEIRQGVPALLKSPYLKGLTALRLPSNHLGNGGVDKLVPALPAVTELNLSVTSVATRSHGSGRDSTQMARAGARAAESLANWPGLVNVQALDLGGWDLGRAGLAKLLDSPYTKGLRSLRVRDIADADWEVDDSLAAFEVGPASTLDMVDIGDNDLDAEAAAYVADARALAELQMLRIDAVRSKHFERLGQARWLHSLRVLAGDEAALVPILKRAPEKASHRRAHRPRADPGADPAAARRARADDARSVGGAARRHVRTRARRVRRAEAHRPPASPAWPAADARARLHPRDGDRARAQHARQAARVARRRPSRSRQAGADPRGLRRRRRLRRAIAVSMKILSTLAILTGCHGSNRPAVENTSRPPPTIAGNLPCLPNEHDTKRWHRQLRAEHALDAEAVAGPMPPAWQVGTCTITPEFNEPTTLMDIVVREHGRTVAQIHDCSMDFHVPTSIPGPQPGDRVGALRLRGCEPALDSWLSHGALGNVQACHDDVGRGYLIQAAGGAPVASDVIAARRVTVCVDI